MRLPLSKTLGFPDPGVLAMEAATARGTHHREWCVPPPLSRYARYSPFVRGSSREGVPVQQNRDRVVFPGTPVLKNTPHRTSRVHQLSPGLGKYRSPRKKNIGQYGRPIWSITNRRHKRRYVSP